MFNKYALGDGYGSGSCAVLEDGFGDGEGYGDGAGNGCCQDTDTGSGCVDRWGMGCGETMVIPEVAPDPMTLIAADSLFTNTCGS